MTPHLPNVFETPAELWDDSDPEGYRSGVTRLGPLVGGALLGMTIWELPPGQSTCPYHYEYGNEEWLVALAGRPTLRTPDGERELAPGDTVCFPVGPDGAHKVTNRTGETARVLLLSTQIQPNAAVYPDSDKIGVWTGNPDDHLLARRSAHVEYFDGEL